jgi:hypothetical protein
VHSSSLYGLDSRGGSAHQTPPATAAIESQRNYGPGSAHSPAAFADTPSSYSADRTPAQPLLAGDAEAAPTGWWPRLGAWLGSSPWRAAACLVRTHGTAWPNMVNHGMAKHGDAPMLCGAVLC